jgi:ribosome biogenesis protein ERB1
MLQRVRSGKYADPEIDPFEDWHFDQEHKEMMHPFSAAPEPKRRFVASKWERLKISKYI